MEFVDQRNRRRFAFATLAAYACAALVAGSVPLLTIGLFPDFGPDPLAARRRITEMMRLMNYVRLGAWGAGAIAILAVAAWVQGACANLEALPAADAPMNRWVATALVLIPGVNLIGAPVVMWLLLRASKEGAGERGDWFRFSGTQLVGVWVAVFLASTLTAVYVMLTFEPSASMSDLANLQLMLLTIRLLDIVFAGVTAMLLHRVDQLQEASRDDVVSVDVFA